MHFVNMNVRGEYDLHAQKVSPTGEVLSESRLLHSGKNLITNLGMNLLGTNALSSFFIALQVGTSGAVPAYTDVNLGGYVAGVGASTAPSFAWVGSNAVATAVYTFGVGAAAGVLAELGLAGGTSGNTLRTHARFEDGSGQPVTVTVLSDEQLIVTYRLVFSVSTADSVFVTTQKGTGYTLTLRPSRIGLPEKVYGQWSLQNRLGWQFTSSLGFANAVNFMYTGASAAIGATNAEPAGTQSAVMLANAQGTQLAYGAYTAGNFYRDDVLSLSLAMGNGADIGAWQFPGTPFSVQVGITPKPTKLNTDVMSFTIRTSWSRE